MTVGQTTWCPEQSHSSPSKQQATPPALTKAQKTRKWSTAISEVLGRRNTHGSARVCMLSKAPLLLPVSSCMGPVSLRCMLMHPETKCWPNQRLTKIDFCSLRLTSHTKAPMQSQFKSSHGDPMCVHLTRLLILARQFKPPMATFKEEGHT